MINPYVIVAAALALFVGGTTLGYRYAQGQAAREEALIQKAGDAAAERAATAIAGIKVNVAPIRERIKETIRELPPMPVECNMPPSVNEEINKARRAP